MVREPLKDALVAKERDSCALVTNFADALGVLKRPIGKPFITQAGDGLMCIDYRKKVFDTAHKGVVLPGLSPGCQALTYHLAKFVEAR